MLGLVFHVSGVLPAFTYTPYNDTYNDTVKQYNKENSEKLVNGFLLLLSKTTSLTKPS